MATDTTAQGLTYRLLQADEWDKLKGLVPTGDGWIPHPQVSAVFVAEDADKNIVGFLVSQLVVHVEPMWVAEPHRNGMAAVALWLGTIKSLKDYGVNIYYSMASDEQVGNYLERLGLKRMPYIPYEGVL